MTEGTKVLNQEENPQNLKEVQQNIDGMLGHAAKNINMGKDPGVGVGGAEFNFLTDMGLAKAGPAGFAAHVHADVFASSGASSSDPFMSSGGGGGKLGSRFYRMKSKNNALGLPKSYGEMLDDARNLERLRAGKAEKGADLLTRTGGSGKDFHGNDIMKKAPLYVTKDQLKRMPHLYGPGVRELVDNDGIARNQDENRSAGAVVAGLVKGHDDARAFANVMESSVLEQAAQRMGEETKARVMEGMVSQAPEETKIKIRQDAAPKGFKAPKPPGFEPLHPHGHHAGKSDDKDRWN